MSIIEAIILGIVQGLTEFLPVSSSGHLVITERILGIESGSLALELVMHLATLCAVVFVYRKKLAPLITHPFSKPVRLLVLATIPTVLIVFAFNSIFRAAFDGRYLVYCFLITAMLLLLSSRSPFIRNRASQGSFGALASQHNDAANKRGNFNLNQGIGKIGYLDAAIIGITQGFAAFPGISRSGSTISMSMMLGNDKSSSADFSFILSIPIIVGSALVELLSPSSLQGIGFFPLVAGFFAAFVSGLFAIKLLLNLLKKSGFDGFVVYLLCLSLFLIANDNFLFLF